jgi:hypothetical protein
MIARIFHIIVLTLLCLSLSGKIVFADTCDNFKSSKEKTVISSNAGDLSDSSKDCQDCGCHCHHGHLDFAYFSNSFSPTFAKIENHNLDFTSLLPAQSISLKRPPKLVS